MSRARADGPPAAVITPRAGGWRARITEGAGSSPGGAASALALVIIVTVCCAPVPRPLVPDLARDVDTDGRPVSVSFVHTVTPGTHVVRFRGTCPTCARWHFHAGVQVDGTVKPPISLKLMVDGEVVTAHDERVRCREDEVGPPRAPTCTLLVAEGWDRLDRPSVSTHLFDLVIANRGPAFTARLFATLMDPHE